MCHWPLFSCPGSWQSCWATFGLALACGVNSPALATCTAGQGLVTPCDSRESVTSPPSLSAADTVPVKPVVPATLHDFVNAKLNVMEFKERAGLMNLLQKWESTDNPRISIAHFGDSHIQGGYAVEAARQRLQQLRGSAGRGMVFPYSIARTYSQNDFKSSFQGEWTTANSMQTTPRLPLGISGFVARTSQSKADFELNFSNAFDPGAKKVRLLFRATHPNYEVTVTSGPITLHKTLHDPFARGQAVLEFDFPELAESLRFEVAAQSEEVGMFDVTGVSIENTGGGLIYHNLGVGGSTYGSLLAQSYLEQEISFIAPDMVILDWGTNDLIYKNTVPENMEDIVTKSIARVRAAYPQAAIVLTSVQDMNFRGRNISSTQKFSQSMRQWAVQNNCLYYDWFRVSGGEQAMIWWYAYGLANPDFIHLSPLGYRVKGELMAQALINTLQELKLPSLGGAELWLTAAANDHPQSVLRWLKTTEPFPRRAEPVIAKASAHISKNKKLLARVDQKPGAKSTLAKSPMNAKKTPH